MPLTSYKSPPGPPAFEPLLPRDAETSMLPIRHNRDCPKFKLIFAFSNFGAISNLEKIMT